MCKTFMQSVGLEPTLQGLPSTTFLRPRPRTRSYTSLDETRDRDETLESDFLENETRRSLFSRE